MSHKIIVESFNDQAIYTHILNNFCRSSTEIEPIVDHLDWVDLGGLERTKLIIKLKDIRSELIKAMTTPKIGIIIDLDNSSAEKPEKAENGGNERPSAEKPTEKEAAGDVSGAERADLYRKGGADHGGCC